MGLVDHRFEGEDGDCVGNSDVSAELEEMFCSMKPASAAATAASLRSAASWSMPRARSRWKSANDIGRPSRMYWRDCDGESEALFGMSASRWVRGWGAAMLRWKSVNDISRPARMYVRDCEGEDSELLYGLSEAFSLPVGGGRLTCEKFVCKGESEGSEWKGSSLEETSSCVLLFASAMLSFWFMMDRLQDTACESGSCIQGEMVQNM